MIALRSDMTDKFESEGADQVKILKFLHIYIYTFAESIQIRSLMTYRVLMSCTYEFCNSVESIHAGQVIKMSTLSQFVLPGNVVGNCLSLRFCSVKILNTCMYNIYVHVI